MSRAVRTRYLFALACVAVTAAVAQADAPPTAPAPPSAALPPAPALPLAPAPSNAATPPAPAQGAPPPLAAPDAGVAAPRAPEAPPLPAGHQPKLAVTVQPLTGVMVGDRVRVTIRADAPEGDDVTISEQSFAPFEVIAKHARVEPAKDGRHAFVFELDLLALEAGRTTLPAVELRVVTSDGVVGATRTEGVPLDVGSLIANEPNAQPKPPTKPVSVMREDYTLVYVAAGVAGAALVVLVTLWISRWWRRRTRKAPPPPPPRPPWEVAVEKLAELRRRKPGMLDAGQGVQFVDLVSDVVREYLGGVFGFDGLESTSDEMAALLRRHGADVTLHAEVRGYLGRCDLVKFAKVVPDRDEVDLLFAKAQDIVQFNRPVSAGAAEQEVPGAAITPPKGAST